MSEFVFDEERHIYTYNGKVLPGVTTVIDDALHPYDCVSRDLMERAANFGKALHKTVQLYLEDDLDEDALDEPLQGCLLAFKAFHADHWDIFEETPVIEKPGYHKRLHYAGTPDLDFPSRVIDLKSRKVHMLTDGMQTAAYDNMTGKGNRERYVLELYQDTSYVLTHVNPTKKSGDLAWSRFRMLLDYYNSTQEIRRWK